MIFILKRKTMKNNNINESILDDIKDLIFNSDKELASDENYQKLKKYFEPIINGVKSSEEITTDVLIPKTTTTDDEFYKKILSCLGAEPTKGNMSFFYAWRQAEGGTAANNPFNTTMKMPGATKYKDNTHGVKNYKSVEDGIEATCKTLKLHYYTDIVNGLKNDVGLKKLSRMSSIKTWGTSNLLASVADGYLSGNSPKPKDINKGYYA
jgi:hypothetical protein